MRVMKEITCIGCGTKATVREQPNGAKYCSWRCFHEYGMRNRIQKEKRLSVREKFHALLDSEHPDPIGRANEFYAHLMKKRRDENLVRSLLNQV